MLEIKEEYPYIINKLIRTINEIGLSKIDFIQTKVIEETGTEIPASYHLKLYNPTEVEIENDCICILVEWGRYCLKYDAIAGFKIKGE